jgi:hypothetical protein
VKGLDAKIHVTHCNFENKLLKHLDAAFVVLCEDEIADLGEVEVKVLVGFAVQFVYKVLDDACAFVRVKVADQHIDIEVLALK